MYIFPGREGGKEERERRRGKCVRDEAGGLTIFVIAMIGAVTAAAVARIGRLHPSASMPRATAIRCAQPAVTAATPCHGSALPLFRRGRWAGCAAWGPRD